MNIYKALNEITRYIDDNLEEKIDYELLARKMGVNVYIKQRIFSLLTDITLAEYIRKRRLSNAGFDLYNSKLKVIDVAMKYQYDNAISFSRAFNKFHGIKPSMVKSNVNRLKNYPRIVFDEKQKIHKEIPYKIIELDEMALYGKGFKTNNFSISSDAPNFFSKMSQKYEILYGHINYGMVIYEDRFNSDNYEYWVLWDKPIKEFAKIVIPKSKWLMFQISNNKARDIQKASHEFYYEFLPSCKYNLRDIPELEHYHDGVTDFLVPIE